MAQFYTDALIPHEWVPGANYSDGSKTNVWYQGRLYPVHEFQQLFPVNSPAPVQRQQGGRPKPLPTIPIRDDFMPPPPENLLPTNPAVAPYIPLPSNFPSFTSTSPVNQALSMIKSPTSFGYGQGAVNMAIGNIGTQKQSPWQKTYGQRQNYGQSQNNRLNTSYSWSNNGS